MTQTNDLLHILVDLRHVYQKQRIAFGNRIAAVTRGSDTMTDDATTILEKYFQIFLQLESNVEEDIAEASKGIEIIQRMQHVKGIGPLHAAKVVALIDIHRADTVSSLWRYAGYGVIDGQRERPTKGEKLHYNNRLKCYLYNVSTSLKMYNDGYAKIYYDSLDYYQANRPDWTEAHCKKAARRKMIKVFLAHLWEEWRKLEGLPVRPLYVVERMGHSHIMNAQEFGWS